VNGCKVLANEIKYGINAMYWIFLLSLTNLVTLLLRELERTLVKARNNLQFARRDSQESTAQQ